MVRQAHHERVTVPLILIQPLSLFLRHNFNPVALRYRSFLRQAQDKRLCLLAPDAGEGGLDLLLEAGDQFAVGGDQRLLYFDLGDDGFLRGERWRGIVASFRLRIGSCGWAAPETIASLCVRKFSD